MNRSLDVIVDSESWAPKPVPPEILSRVGTRNVDILAALIFTALATRPPTVRGFYLSDYWAWLRYIPAIARTNRLKLCEEWWNVDRHQKSVLSDELGVGFTTQFMTEAFKCSEFTDTLYVVNILDPTRLFLKGEAKQGPQKSPDYIARDTDTNYIVLECKGSQSSQSALREAVSRGRAQKENIGATNSAYIKHSLVAGLFIPQWRSSEGSCILISDPPREDLKWLFSEHSRERIRDVITQVGLAKQFALAGLVAVPAYLVSLEHIGLPEPPESVRTEIHRRTETATGDYNVIFDSDDLRARMPTVEPSARARFLARAPLPILNQLGVTSSVSELISGLSARSTNSLWKIHSDDFAAEVITPLGFSFRLEVEPS